MTLAAVAIATLASCDSQGDGSDQVAGARTDLTTETPNPTTDISVSGTAPRSEVTVSGEAPRSSAEVRVGEILSELDTSTTPEGTVITLPEVVLFDFDQAELKDEARATLAEVLDFYADAPVEVRGHTDSRGDEATTRACPSAGPSPW